MASKKAPPKRKAAKAPQSRKAPPFPPAAPGRGGKKAPPKGRAKMPTLGGNLLGLGGTGASGMIP